MPAKKQTPTAKKGTGRGAGTKRPQANGRAKKVQQAEEQSPTALVAVKTEPQETFGAPPGTEGPRMLQALKSKASQNAQGKEELARFQNLSTQGKREYYWTSWIVADPNKQTAKASKVHHCINTQKTKIKDFGWVEK